MEMLVSPAMEEALVPEKWKICCQRKKQAQILIICNLYWYLYFMGDRALSLELFAGGWQGR